MTEQTFTDAHGVDVLWRRWDTAQPAGIVVIAHGASEHSGRYDRFARALNDADLAVYALDHRGHGGTAQSTGVGRMGPPGGDAVIEDLDLLVDLSIADHPGIPVLLFGHSMGSAIGLGYLARHATRLRAAVLCGMPVSMNNPGSIAAMFQQAVDAGLADQPMEMLAAPDLFEQRTAFDWLSRDAAEVDRYIADPMCGNSHPLTYGYLFELFTTLIALTNPDALRTITCPVLVIAGDQDMAAGNGENARLLESALHDAGVTVKCKLYEGARHELLNETNRNEVTADIVAWFRRSLA
jgi:alpha-beta hydrolase superfamily lysophospholipase